MGMYKILTHYFQPSCVSFNLSSLNAACCTCSPVRYRADVIECVHVITFMCICVCIDTQRALLAVERLQQRLKKRGELPAEEKLSLLKSVLQSPLFHQILIMQESGQQHQQLQVRESSIIIPVHDTNQAHIVAAVGFTSI